MVSWLILGVLLCAAYLLYQKGCFVTKSIAAVMFLFRAEKNRDRVSVNSCRGWVLHVGKFRESRVYEFTLDSQLSSGDATVALLDKDKRELLRLSLVSPFGSIPLNGKNKYYLRWEFHSATGTCELRW